MSGELPEMTDVQRAKITSALERLGVSATGAHRPA